METGAVVETEIEVQTRLIAAITNGDETEVEDLLTKGANIDAQDEVRGNDRYVREISDILYMCNDTLGTIRS